MSFDGSRGPPTIEGMTSLKVDNLSYRTNIDELKQMFGKYGELGDIYIPQDRNTQRSRGFAFVRFYEKRDAEDAMDGVDGQIYDGREIRVQNAKYGRPRYNKYDRRQGGGGSGRYERGYDRHGGFNRNKSSYSRRRRSRSRSYSPKRRSASRSPARKRGRSRSRSPPRRQQVRQQSRSPEQNERSASRSPKRRRSKSGSPQRRDSPSPARSASPEQQRRKSPASEQED